MSITNKIVQFLGEEKISKADSNKVEKALKKMNIKGLKVRTTRDLLKDTSKKNFVIVSFDKWADNNTIKKAVEQLGYKYSTFSRGSMNKLYFDK